MSESRHRRDEPAPADLAARIERAAAPALDELHVRARRRTVLALGAVLAIPALLVIWRAATPAAPLPAVRPDARWLSACVGPDGRFAPEWTGPRDAEPGLQGLALLALARSQEGDAAAISRAAGWLVERQRPDGALADAAQDHAVATLALIESWRRTGDARLHAGAESAVTCLIERLAEGLRPAQAEAAWSLRVVLAAQDTGLGAEHRAALARARTGLQAAFGGPLDRAELAEATLSPDAAPRRSGLGELYVATVALLAADLPGSGDPLARY